MSKDKRPHQVSVRGEVYDRLRAVAVERGVTIAQVVEAALADTLGQQPVPSRRPAGNRQG